LEFELTAELKELQERARHFVEQELIPHEITVDTTEALPKPIRAQIRQKALDYGLWPMNVPKELGGLGSSVMEQTIVQEQAGRATKFKILSHYRAYHGGTGHSLAAGGWPGWDGRAFDPLGGNARHGGTSAYPRTGGVLFYDGHGEWSRNFGPDMPWNKNTWTRRPD